MYRYKLTLEYKGHFFKYGWQKQADKTGSVQGEIELALRNLSQQNVAIYGSGRTDRGVHARGQVAHVDLHKVYDTTKMQSALNFYLQNKGCKIANIEIVKDDFHARFSAKNKIYKYFILNSNFCSIFDENYAWWIKEKIDLERLRAESKKLVGTHNFSSFAHKSAKNDTPIRTLSSVDIHDYGHNIEITFSSRSFLHKQIRIMVGTLIEIVMGTMKFDINYILSRQDRRCAGRAAPPCGLFLHKIIYD